MVVLKAGAASYRTVAIRFCPVAGVIAAQPPPAEKSMRWRCSGGPRPEV
jgi:hypothetical protein